MRYSIWIPTLLCLTALTACGNANDGLSIRKSSAVKTASASTAGASLADPRETYGPCATATVLGGSNPSYAQIFAGTQFCRGISRPSQVMVKVNATFPSTGRFCLVPMTDVALPESCFTVNGQAVVNLQTSAYSTLVILAESDLAAYKAFLNYQFDTAPPRAMAILNTQ